MIKFMNEYGLFEIKFNGTKRNDNCPLVYEKESAVKKPTPKHVSAIIRSIHLLESGLDEVIEARFKIALERDMVIMSEVKDMLWALIENPTLPFLEQSADSVDPGPVSNVS